MHISLSNYRPLDLTNSLIRLYSKQPMQNWNETAKKVGLAALVAIAILPTLLADAVCCGIKFFSKLQKAPVPPTLIKLSATEEIPFFKKSIDNALEKMNTEHKSLYLQLLTNHGVLDNFEEHTIGDIFQWSAACLIAECLLNHRSLNDLYGDLKPNDFYLLPPEEKKTIISQIQVPETKLELTKDCRSWVEKIRAQASRITQDSSYIKLYQKIYPIYVHLS